MSESVPVDGPLPSVDRLRWQCRRGMLELDLALLAYLERRYDGLDDAGKHRFVELLAIDDPTLNAWLLDYAAPPDAGTAALIRAIRACAAGSDAAVGG